MRPQPLPTHSHTHTHTTLHPEQLPQNFILDGILVQWLNPVINLAHSLTHTHTHSLQTSDIWSLDSTEMSVEKHSTLLSAEWMSERVNAREENRQPSLRHTIFRVYKYEFLRGGFYQLIFFILQLIQPFIIGKLLEYLSNDGVSEGVTVGLMWSLILGIVAFFSSNSLILAFSNNRRFSTFIRAALMMNIYEHSMHITNASRMKNDIGTTTNLMAIDSEKVSIAVQMIHFLWHGPLTILAVMVILMTQIGFIPALIGMVCVALTIPIQSKCARVIGSMRRQMVTVTDTRVALISEVLQIIRAVKLYAWETMLFTRVKTIRAEEIRTMWRYIVSNALLRDVNQISPVVTACLIFTTLVFVVYNHHPSGDTENNINGGSDDSSHLTTARAVTILAYLNIIRFPLQLLGVALKFCVDGNVSLVRLNAFFMLDVLPPRESGSESVDACDGDSDASIVFKGASFSWLATEKNANHGAVLEIESDEKQISDASSHKKDTYSQVVSSPLFDTDEGDHSAGKLDRDDESASFKIKSSQSSLTDLNITIEAGELIAVIGTVGSGKSNFIAAILGEMPCTQGRCSVHGNVAYSAQTPWIQNMTVQDNILFGDDLASTKEPHLSEQYKKCLHQAALSTDLKNLPHGDQTEIGERGINLSGGQKSRVSFCRALLASRNRDIVILDDPFSSVDGLTGNWMFTHGVQEGLRGKIRIVALNSHLHLLKHFDRVLVLDEGKVALLVTPELLFSTHRDVYEQVLGSLQQQNHSSGEGEDVMDISDEISAGSHLEDVQLGSDDDCLTVGKPDVSARNTIESLDSNGDSDKDHAGDVELVGLPRKFSVASSQDSSQLNEGLIAAEVKTNDAISIYTYFSYFGAAFWNDQTTPEMARSLTLSSVVACSGLLFAFMIAQAMRVYCDVVLLQWVDEHEAGRDSVYFKLYLSCVASFIVLIALRSCVLSLYATAVCKSIHNMLFRKILNAPVPEFFDVTMVGNILNRFAKDMETTDVTIPEYLNMFLFQLFSLSSVVGLCIWSVPPFIVLVVPVVIFVVYMFLRFAPFSRDIKRLESVSRTPVYSSFSETLTGLETIRAYGVTKRFLSEHLQRMDTNHKLFYHMTMGQCWLTARMELSGVYFLVSISIVSVLVKEFTQVSQAKVGLAMVYTLQLTAMFQRCVQLAMDLQMHFTSVERIVQFIDIPQEKTVITVADDECQDNKISSALKLSSTASPLSRADLEVGPKSLPVANPLDLPPSWPESGGTIAFVDLWMRYRANTPFVLKGVSFHVAKGERVGICGRTGAGKSSIIQALFRIVESHSGHIRICDVDTRRIPLPRLRSVLAIIPQDPVLLKGSIRYQLDPFEMYSDEEVWEVLKKVNMVGAVRAMEHGLNEPVAENGDNLSQGEKQLLCIARSLLRRAKILVLDEATSACDPVTDDIIQQVLKSECTLNGTTVLTIAHRLHTIIDFDKILVMSAGVVAEYDSPGALLADSASEFSKMLEDYNSSHR